ncbi:hypothetical protein EMGBD2_18340 [Nitrospirota bacterium]|jgi:hypothetical protein|nr:hypothetical protein EMGBD2_18340 [Nitrospirota bacterium]
MRSPRIGWDEAAAGGGTSRFAIAYVWDERDGSFVFLVCIGSVNGGATMKQGYRLVIVDKDGVLVSEFQLTEKALAEPEAFVVGIQAAIEQVEEEEP